MDFWLNIPIGTLSNQNSLKLLKFSTNQRVNSLNSHVNNNKFTTKLQANRLAQNQDIFVRGNSVFYSSFKPNVPICTRENENHIRETRTETSDAQKHFSSNKTDSLTQIHAKNLLEFDVVASQLEVLSKCADCVICKEEFFSVVMAECLASPLLKLQMQKSFASAKPRSSHFKIMQRKHSYGNREAVSFPMWKQCHLTAPGFSSLRVSQFCLGTLVGSGSAAASDWVPIADEVLLTASVFLTYMAGVIPGYNSSSPLQKNIHDNPVRKTSSASGSARKNNDPESSYPIDVVKTKLLDSLRALELGDNLGNRVLEPEGYYAKRPLSLNAIADGPRLQLLWKYLQRIEEEVKSISSSQTLNLGYSLTDFSVVIQNSCLPVCTSWLESELDLLSSKRNKALVLLMDAKLNGDNSILQSIRNSGKQDLYAELLYFLSFGSLREGCSYDSGLFMVHGVSMLEDLVITLSDGIVSIYLELISVDSTFSDEMDSVSLALCPLSTRALQRLRNEVALYQWLYQNLEAVASMYEDRFDLWTLESQLIKNVDNSWNENYSWWKRLIRKKADTASSTIDQVLINNFSMPVKRTKELRALIGWRYYFSLFLELSDISMPLVRAVIDKVSKATSFFLVCLIGRSLGLIYTGIRQSLRWK